MSFSFVGLSGAPIAILITSVAILSCGSASEVSEGPFEIERTPAARISEATSIVRVRIGDSRPLMFEKAAGGREVCGYHARAETLTILDGPPVGRDFISNTALQRGEEYVVAILDMRGKLPEIVEHPHVSEDDRNFARCRDLYEQYSLGSAPIAVVDGLERVDVASSDLVPRVVRDKATNGSVTLSLYLDTVRDLRGAGD